MQVLIVGGTRGIGAAWAERLQGQGHEVWVAGRQASGPGQIAMDLADPESITAGIAQVRQQAPELQQVINTAGVLHWDQGQPEKSLRQLNPQAALYSYQVNALGPALLAQALWDVMRKTKHFKFASLSARVSSISDNRLGGWHSYRASKAAQNMMLKNVALELGRVNPSACVALLHPGTVDTDLSKPFQSRVPSDKLFDVQRAAAQLDQVLQDFGPADSGVLRDWAGEDIVF